MLDKDACKEAQRFAEPGVPISTKNLEYMKQLTEQKRYQVYATPTTYLSEPVQPLIEYADLAKYVPPGYVEPEAEAAGTPSGTPDSGDDSTIDPDSFKPEEQEKPADEEPEYLPESALWKIDSPVFLLVAGDDLSCPRAQAEWIEKELNTTATKQLRVYENADHEFFTWSNQQGFHFNVLQNIQGAASAAFQAHIFSAGVTALALAAALY